MKWAKIDLIEWMVDSISLMLDCPASKVDTDGPFLSLGLSSLDLVELANKLEHELGEELNPTVFFEYPTINSLAVYLEERSNNSDAKQAAHYFQQNKQGGPIAIVGMSCRFPGAPDADSFWELLKEKRTAIQEFPQQRAGKEFSQNTYAGLITDHDKFDAQLFQIKEQEARSMDPQQRIILELTWRALEDAGLTLEKVSNSSTGVFVGISTSDYFLEKVLKDPHVSLYDGTGFAHSISANRISYFFNLKGPSLSLDTACSSSHVAVHQACLSLEAGRCEYAIVGGVNLLSSPFLFEAFQKANMLSSTGTLKAFSEGADGYIRGEGGGVLILTRESLAIDKGHRIRALIRGSALNQDGKTSTLTAPNLTAQEQVLKSALDSAGCLVDDIDYIEAHGTGTPLGDPIEYKALKNVYLNKEMPLFVGSVKTNIGHLEAAAGMAGLIKAILSLERGLIPAQINFKELNRNIDTKNSKINILTQEHPLNDDGKNHKIGVSSFGFGGTNAHVILEQANKFEPARDEFPLESPLQKQLFLFSASTPQSLKETLKNYPAFFKKPYRLDDIALSLMSQRNHLESRMAFIAKSKEQALDLLHSYENEELNSVMTGNQKKGLFKKKAFVFSGQGSQFPKMGHELYLNHPIYREVFNKVIKLFAPYFEKDLFEVWCDQEGTEMINQTDYSQALIFANQMALFHVWKDMKVEPDYLLGHSLGEISAVCAAGGLTLESAVKLVALRGLYMQKAPEGKMLIVFATTNHIQSFVDLKPLQVSFAAYNAPLIQLLSGPCDSIDFVQDKLKQNNVKTKLLKAQKAFHSALMENVALEFRREIEEISYSPLQYRVISCSTLNILNEKDLNAEFWYRHLLNPTQFQQAVQIIDSADVDYILEIGPSTTLGKMIPYCLKQSKPTLLCSLNKEKDDLDNIMNTMGKLYTLGYNLNFQSLFESRGASCIELPFTSFAKTHYWLNSSDSKIQSKPAQTETRPLLLSKSQYQEQLTKIIAHELEADEQDLDFSAELIDMGADSLVLLNTLEKINEHFGVDISVSDIFEKLKTLEDIAEYLASYHVKKANIAPVSSPPPQFNVTTETTGMGVLGNFKTSYKDSQTSDQEVDTQKNAYLTKLINHFNTRTKGSKDWTQFYREKLADNRVSAGFRPSLKEAVYPIHFKKAKGAYFWDIDGNKYVDFTMGFGVNLFGHSPDFIEEPIREQLDMGMAVGPQSNLAGPVADLLGELTGHQRVAFVNSGTEALMTAIRLARAATQRQTLIIFEGSYHGHFDGVLGRMSSRGKTVPVAAGIPFSITQELVVLKYGEQESLDYIKANGQQIAAVLVEPVQSRYPDHKPKDFLQKIRHLTEQSGSAFIFDEVITGFRLGNRGAQGYFDIKADMATYGKIIGGGLPIGAIAGDSKYLDFIDGGAWAFGDNSLPRNELTFFAGTFSKHPLTMSASYALLLKMKKEGKEVVKELNQKTETMAHRLNQYFEKLQISLRVIHFGSLFRFKFTGNYDWLFIALNARGFYVWEGRNMFLSTAHSDEDINSFIQTTQEIVHELLEVNYIGPKKETTSSHSESKSSPMTSSHFRFKDLILSDSSTDQLSTQIVSALKIQGDLEVDLFCAVIEEILSSRYDSLHAFYDLEQSEIKFSHEYQRRFKVARIDFSQIDNPSEAFYTWQNQMAHEFLGPNDRPITVYLVQLEKNNHRLYLMASHMNLDGLSLAFIMDEISKLYNARVLNKPFQLKSPYPFLDFLDEYPKRLNKMEDSKKYWNEEAKKWPSLIFPELGNHKMGSRVHCIVPSVTYKKVKMFGYKNKSSLLVSLLGAFSRHLNKVFQKQDFVIFTPAAGHTTIGKTMVGNCVNLIPLSIHHNNESSFSEFIAWLKQYQFEIFKHSEYPYTLVLDQGQPRPGQIVFNVEPISELPKLKGLELDLEQATVHASEFPLMINVMRLNSELHIDMDFQFDLFTIDQAQDFLDSFAKSLEEL